MLTVILDGQAMVSRRMAHETLSTALNLPEHYGRNLDALYDCLTTYSTPVAIILENVQAMLAALGRYGVRLLTVLYDAAEENPNLVFSVAP